jgi:hypothetical protein
MEVDWPLLSGHADVTHVERLCQDPQLASGVLFSAMVMVGADAAPTSSSVVLLLMIV